MKACIIQPFYSMDYSRSDELLQWELDALDLCDDSMDIIVLPEYADVPALASTREAHFASTGKYNQKLLDKCRETARRCQATLFVNASCETPTGPRNSTFAFDRQGNEAGRYDKRHLVPRETDKLQLDSSYTCGFSEPTVLTIDGIRYGFLTCYDFYFYESYPALARQKVDVIIGCSHQRSDTLQATELICRFCAYHTNAYVIRASVCLEPGGNVGGGSMIVSPYGTVLANMENRVGMTCAEFDPADKYYKPAGFGNPPAPHYEYIDQGRRPWQYRPAGSAICLPDRWMPYPRVCAWDGISSGGAESTMMALGAAVALDAPEVGFELLSANGEAVTRDGVPLERILRKFSCHTILNIRLGDGFDEQMLRQLTELIFRYDCTRYVTILSESGEVLRHLKQAAPWIICCTMDLDTALAAGCEKVLLDKSRCTRETVERAHALGLRCGAFGVDTQAEARHLLALGVDTLVTRNYREIAPAAKAYRSH